MATLTNRSSYTVRVPRRAELARTFSHEDLKGAREYLNELRRQGHRPKLEQGDDHWYVRIRQKGYAELNFDGGSWEEAKATAARIEGERATGLFRDYTKAHRVTFAELIGRYVEEVCPRHKIRVVMSNEPSSRACSRISRLNSPSGSSREGVLGRLRPARRTPGYFRLVTREEPKSNGCSGRSRS